ncbi:MAG: hypothetical protein Q9216_003049 [Gyalolechia sp. 2 TL-2023]
MEMEGHACEPSTVRHSLMKAKQTVLPLTAISLHDGWRFRQTGDDEGEWMPVAQFPTNVHLDLIHNKIIPDPYIAKNEVDVQWVGEKSWVYKTNFKLSALSSQQMAVIAFDGLDTHATVFLNGREILRTENMFIPERVDVTRDIRSSTENELEIMFESTYLIGKKLVEAHPKHKYGCWNGDPSRLAVRKAQYQYGWDWGPALLTCGPWRPISLELYASRIEDLFFMTRVDESLKWAEVTAKCRIEGDATEVKFQISINSKNVTFQTVKVARGLASAVLRTQKPELWYPARYGKQPLYDLQATLMDRGNVLDQKRKRFGLRRAEVVQRQLDDAPGTTFYFQVNNIPIFCGGSNWIPADSFIPKIDPSRYRDWIKLGVEGNQSMIRIWGGGIFEEQHFYDACDEMGMLVWQDFMFACGNYPGTDEFLDLVKREATANVERLRHHPCIVIWAGNNEDYQYRETEKLEYDQRDQNPDNWLKSDFPARYIYEKILADATQELVPDTYYHFGSPFGGKDTTDPTIGDIHQWNVWHGTQERYQAWDKLCGRFVAEFGMEAFPSVKTIDSYLLNGREDAERHAQASTVDFHNKALGGEGRLATYLVQNIPYSHSPFEYYIYCTQIMQSECLATAFRLWKREWKGPGQEHCGGALVWQINDCWPTQSWSIVDYYLRPKLAYYTIKREMADITINMKRVVEEIPADSYTRAYVKEFHKVQLFGTNLSLQDRTYLVRVQAWDLDAADTVFLESPSDPIQLKRNRSTEVAEYQLGSSKEAASIVIAAYLLDPTDGSIAARSVNWPEPLKYVQFPKLEKLRMEIIRTTKGNVIELGAEVPAKGVALEINDDGDSVVLEDNCVDLFPDEVLQIGVKGLEIGEEHRITLRYLKAAVDR